MTMLNPWDESCELIHTTGAGRVPSSNAAVTSLSLLVLTVSVLLILRNHHLIPDMASSAWAVSQLSQILPLDETSIQQLLDYTSTLPKDAAAEHLKNLLGDTPKALEFISSYNARREAPSAPSSTAESPRGTRKPHKKKPPLNKLPTPRQVEDYGDVAGAYKKKDEEDYMAGNRRQRQEPTLAKTLALSDQPDARQLPQTTSSAPLVSSKPPPSAAGPLISDLPNVRSGSRASSRTSSPAPKTKVNIAGGASMHGASTTLQDLVHTILSLQAILF